MASILILLLYCNIMISQCWLSDLKDRLVIAEKSTLQEAKNFVDFVKNDPQSFAKYRMLYDAGGIEYIQTKNVEILNDFYNDYATATTEIKNFFKETPKAINAWVILQDASLDVTLKQNKAILQKVIDCEFGIKELGGYANWKKAMDPWEELVTDNQYYNIELGRLYNDSGGYKNIYELPNNPEKVIAILKPSDEGIYEFDIIIDEIRGLNELKGQGLPTVEVIEVTIHNGLPAYVMQKYVSGSKHIENPGILNQKSIEDLNLIQQLLREKDISVDDLQFLIDTDGSVVIADPGAISTYATFSYSNEHTISKLIKVATLQVAEDFFKDSPAILQRIKSLGIQENGANFYLDYYEANAAVLRYVKENPAAVDAWRIMDQARLSREVKNHLPELQNIVNNLDDIKVAGGYRSWLETLELEQGLVMGKLDDLLEDDIFNRLYTDTQNNQKIFKISIEQEAAIRYYVASGVHQKFNRSLAGRSPMLARYDALKDLLIEAGKKLPKYRNKVHKGANLFEKEILENLDYGEIFDFNGAFTSTSKDIDIAYQYAKGNQTDMIITVLTPKGTDISEISPYDEVLLMPNARFEFKEIRPSEDFDGIRECMIQVIE